VGHRRRFDHRARDLRGGCGARHRNRLRKPGGGGLAARRPAGRDAPERHRARHQRVPGGGDRRSGVGRHRLYGGTRRATHGDGGMLAASSDVERRDQAGPGGPHKETPTPSALCAGVRFVRESPAILGKSSSAREKVARVLHRVSEVVASSTFSCCIPALIDAAEPDHNLRKFYTRFQRAACQPLIKVNDDGVADGRFPPHVDPELAAFVLLGAIFLSTNDEQTVRSGAG
jgi:hypothetical protein